MRDKKEMERLIFNAQSILDEGMYEYLCCGNVCNKGRLRLLQKNKLALRSQQRKVHLNWSDSKCRTEMLARGCQTNILFTNLYLNLLSTRRPTCIVRFSVTWFHFCFTNKEMRSCKQTNIQAAVQTMSSYLKLSDRQSHRAI